MKKKLICLLSGLAIVTLTSCGSNNSKTDDTATQIAQNDTGSGMYEYSEEVPVPLNGQQDATVAEQNSDKTPCVVDFSATWCGPCQKLKPYFEEMEKTYEGQAVFRTIDIDENKALAEKYNVNAVPTVIIFSDSSMQTELYRVTGFDPQGLEEAIMNNL